MMNQTRGGANFSGTKVSNMMREALATPAKGVWRHPTYFVIGVVDMTQQG